jgi:hypothetical protein
MWERAPSIPQIEQSDHPRRWSAYTDPEIIKELEISRKILQSKETKRTVECARGGAQAEKNNVAEMGRRCRTVTPRTKFQRSKMKI